MLPVYSPMAQRGPYSPLMLAVDVYDRLGLAPNPNITVCIRTCNVKPGS